jgi:phosphoserine phosphatase RsbU/P
MPEQPSVGAHLPKRAFLRLGWVAFAALFATALPAQSIQPIAPQQCVWHAGDNPAWAAPNLDESGWQSFAQLKLPLAQTHIWLRCHADLTALRGMAHPAIQVSIYSAYQLYLNGAMIGQEGNLSTGSFSVDAVRSYPAPAGTLPSEPAVVALRISKLQSLTNFGPMRNSLNGTPGIRAGDAALLGSIRADQIVAGASRRAEPALCFGIIGVLAIPLLGVFLFDRTRRALLFLGLTCLILATLRVNEFLDACLIPYPMTVSLLIVVLGNIALTFTHYPFFYALAGRRIPLSVRVLLVVIALAYVPIGFAAIWGVGEPAWLPGLTTMVVRPSDLALNVILSVLPFVVFWPYRSIAPRMRPLAVLCMVWSVVDFVWYLVEATGLPIPGVPNYFLHWDVAMLDARGIVTACVLAALMGLLFREQRQAAQERALLAGEMQAASEIQRMLAPAAIDTAPGLRIDVAFHPMREVGGDFYFCRVLPDGRQRLVLGDVSGKGAAAAMTATLLLGAAAARDSDAPASLLHHLNRVLRENHLSGFATCLCADIASNGTVMTANAGHLPPYRNGEELPIDSGLPLGVAAQAEYSETTFQLAPSDIVTFLSDGVVEARNAQGELFGFDRTRAVSAHPADQIARAAELFGQEDDITVLTLTFAPAGVLHA